MTMELPQPNLVVDNFSNVDGNEVFVESEMRKSMGVLLDDDFVETKFENFPVWALTTKTSKLTFLDKYEVPMFEALHEAMLCKYFRSVPPCLHNDEMYQLADQARAISMLNLRRSAGSENSNKLNERTALVTQIRQSLPASGQGGMTSKPGFIKRLFGMK